MYKIKYDAENNLYCVTQVRIISMAFAILNSIIGDKLDAHIPQQRKC